MISDAPFFKGGGPFEKIKDGVKNRPLRQTPSDTDYSDCPPERTSGTNGFIDDMAV